MGVKFHRHIVRTCTIHIRARKSSEEIDLSTVTRTTYNQDTKMESSKFSKNMSASKHNVHLLLVACSAFMFLMLSSMLPQTELFFQELAVSLTALLLKNTGIEDLDLVKLKLLVQLHKNLSTKNLPRFQNLFQDKQKYKKLKQTKFLNKNLSSFYQMPTFHHLLVLMVLDLHIG